MLRASDGILELLPIATFICDARGTILQYNHRAAEIWGRTPRPGQTLDQFTENWKYFMLDGTPAEHTMMDEVLAGGEAVRDVERIVEREDGSRVIVSINIDPLRDAGGAVVGAVNCFIDITERKRVDAALENSRQLALEQEQRLAATYEHAAIGIAELAPDGSFLRVNEAICDITGYSRDELLSAGRLFRSTHPEDTEPDNQAFHKQLAGELEFYSVEKRFVRKDGRVIWMSVSSSPVRDADGNLLYLVRVVQDITERKAAEQRNRLLIDELNHRVKNTLATVQSLASQTARGVPSPEEFRDRFEGRLIALSKAHDQLTMHHWESADLRELLSGVAGALCRRRAGGAARRGRAAAPARGAHARHGVPRACHQRRQIRRAVGARRQDRDPLAARAARRRRARLAAHRLGRAGRPPGRRAAAARLRHQADRGRRQGRARRQRQPAIRRRGPALRIPHSAGEARRSTTKPARPPARIGRSRV